MISLPPPVQDHWESVWRKSPGGGDGDAGLHHVNERPQEKSLTLMSSSCFCLAGASCCLVIYNVSNQRNLTEPNQTEPILVQ